MNPSAFKRLLSAEQRLEEKDLWRNGGIAWERNAPLPNQYRLQNAPFAGPSPTTSVARRCGDLAGWSKASGFRRPDQFRHRIEWVWIFLLADERQEAVRRRSTGKRGDIPAAGDVLKERGLPGIGQIDEALDAQRRELW